MRRFLVPVAVLLLLPGFATAAQQLYTCGMHPQVIRNEPGDCPICGMVLTPVRAGAASAGALQITIDPVMIQRMNLKTELVQRGAVRRELRIVGTVAYNEAGLHDITTKYEGWIERMFVNATWSAVQAGDPLFEVYSPDLYNAQLNYLVAVRAEGEGEGRLTRSALARLQLFDVSEAFIAALKQSGEAQRTYVYHSPVNGVVIEKMVVPGQMMKPGERIYRIADVSTVWVHAQIFEGDLPFVQPGQAVAVRTTYGSDRELPGTVALLLPQVEEQTRTATARIVLPNPDGQLRPGMFVDVRLATQLTDSAVLVPDVAILRSGETNTVFLARPDGSFEPRAVQLGARIQDGRYEVRAGLNEGDRVVTSGQFMLDSESRHREGIQKMLRAGAEVEGRADAPLPAAEGPPSSDAPAGGYVCPMREHTPTPLDAPGKCATCGMTLVPVKANAPAGHAH